MSLTTKLQKLTVLSFIMVIVSSIVFAVTLVVTSKEISKEDLYKESPSVFKKSVTTEHLKALNSRGPSYIEENDDKTIITSQHILMPYLWNAIIACMALLVCSVVALIWDAQRQGKINILEALDLDYQEELAKD
jgi:hypothetical protein